MKILATALVATVAWLPEQAEPELRRLFEAGRYQEIVQSVGETASPGARYLAGQSHEKLKQPGPARAVYERLAAGSADNAWTHIGRSALLVLDGRAQEAAQAATDAVGRNPQLAQAHYQLGLARGHANDFAGAAQAFDEAGTLDRSFAYAHYNAGLSYYRVKRIDVMAARFEAFLSLAPDAPERAQVQSIMRTVRGR